MTFPRSWLFALRVAVTVTLCFVVARAVDLTEVGGLLARVRTDWLAASLGIHFAAHVCYAGSVRWVLDALGHPLPLNALLANHYKGLFFGSFLPTNLGGDVYRFVDLARLTGDRVRSIMAIALQRAFALLTTLVFVAVAVPAFSPVSIGLSGGVSAAAVGLGILVAIALALEAPRRLESSLRRRAWAEGFLRRWTTAHEAFGQLRRRGPRVGVLAYIVGYQLLTVTGAYAMARGLEVNLGWPHFCYVVPLSLLAGALPIAINGIGVREGVYIGILTQLGIARADALALALLLLGVTVLSALVGGLLYAVGKQSGSAVGPATGGGDRDGREPPPRS